MQVFVWGCRSEINGVLAQKIIEEIIDGKPVIELIAVHGVDRKPKRMICERVGMRN